MGGNDADRLLALGRYAREAILTISEDGRIASRASAPILGYVEGVVGRHLAEVAHPDDLGAVLSQLERVRQRQPGSSPVQVRARHRDGHWVTLTAEVIDARDDPDVSAVVLRLWRDRTTEEPDPRVQGIEPLAEALSTGILVADGDSQVVYANAAATELFWMTLPHLLGDGWCGGVCPDDLAEVRSTAKAALTGPGRQDVNFQISVGRDHTRWVHGRFQSLGSGPTAAGWVAVLEDITRQRASEAALAHRATHDKLTGLPDRLLLRDRLEQAIARPHRAGQHVALLFIDLDGFKSVNDRYGHAAGDAALVEVARRISGALRPGDTASRIGGDEFVVLAEGLNAEEASAIGGRIAREVGRPITVSGHRVELGTSIGLALAGAGDEPDDVILRADQAMYRAKRDGGTRLHLAGGAAAGGGGAEA